MKKESKKEFNLTSFLNEESMANFNAIAMQLGIKYVKKHIRKPVEEKINYKKLMETPPGFDKGDND